MTQPPAPVVIRSRHTLPLIWVVPLVAFLVGGWLIARNWRDHGPEIVIHFQTGSGLEAGKTVLEYRGVAVGTVQSVELDGQLKDVIVKVQLANNAPPIARQGSQFWLVRPEIGFSGIKGLDTLITGARLMVRPGTGAPATEFTALTKAPLIDNTRRGRSFILRSEKLGALTPGAPVYFRGVKVGFVEAHRLAPEADSVLVRIRIRAPYHQLVHTDTRFWNSGGVSVKIGLLGAEIHSNSLESLIAGGVAFATPDSPSAKPADDGAEFPIADEADKAWLQWNTKISLPEPDESWQTTAEEPAPAN
jgi:paraquat-inducible protein B